MLSIKATPRFPNPDKKKVEIVAEQEVENIVADDTTAKGEVERTPREYHAVQTSERQMGPKELRLTRRMFEKFGYSDDCEGCH